MRQEIKEVSDNLLAESAARSKAALQNINEAGYPMSASDHRAKADAHDAKADELKDGVKKESHQVAARANNRAADAIDKANLATKKAEAFD